MKIFDTKVKVGISFSHGATHVFLPHPYLKGIFECIKSFDSMAALLPMGDNAHKFQPLAHAHEIPSGEKLANYVLTSKPIPSTNSMCASS